MRANARLGRIGVAGAIAAVPFGVLALKAVDPAAPLYLAAVIYAMSAALAIAAAAPRRAGTAAARARRPGPRADGPGAAARSCRRWARSGCGRPAGSCCSCSRSRCATPRCPRCGSRSWRGGGRRRIPGRRGRAGASHRSPRGGGRDRVAVGRGDRRAARLAAVRAPVAARSTRCRRGAAAEFARLAFQALMQRHAPPEALGRVFVRYEVAVPGRVGAGRVRAGVAADRVPHAGCCCSRCSTAASRRLRGAGACGRRRRGRPTALSARLAEPTQAKEDQRWGSSSRSGPPTRSPRATSTAFEVEGDRDRRRARRRHALRVQRHLHAIRAAPGRRGGEMRRHRARVRVPRQRVLDRDGRGARGPGRRGRSRCTRPARSTGRSRSRSEVGAAPRRPSWWSAHPSRAAPPPRPCARKGSTAGSS